MRKGLTFLMIQEIVLGCLLQICGMKHSPQSSCMLYIELVSRPEDCIFELMAIYYAIPMRSSHF